MKKIWLVFAIFVISSGILISSVSPVLAEQPKKCEDDADDGFIIDDCRTISSRGIKFEFTHGYQNSGSSRFNHLHRLTWELPKASDDSCCSFEESDQMSDSHWSLTSMNGDILKFTLEYESPPAPDETEQKLYRASHCWKLKKDRKSFEELSQCPIETIRKNHSGKKKAPVAK